MRTIQKLELFAGIATFVAMIMFIYFVDVPLSRKIAEQYNDLSGYHWMQTFLLLILPSLVVAISSYAHALKNNKVALSLILLIGGILSFLYGIGFLTGAAFEGHILIGVSPGLFAFATIVFALINGLSFSVKRGNLP